MDRDADELSEALKNSCRLKSFIHNGNLSNVVNFLCEKGSSVNTSLLTCDENTTFPLHVAVDVEPEHYNHHLVTKFISMGANYNILDGDGFAPLHYAAKHNNTTAAKELLDAGADVNLGTNPQFPTVLECLKFRQTIRKWSSQMTHPLNLILKTHYDVLNGPVMPYTGRSHCAVPVDLVKLLLSYGADCNLYDGNGFAAIHYAVMLNDIHLVELLLDAGADINISSRENIGVPLSRVRGLEIPQGLVKSLDTPISLAKDVSMLKFLFSRNADPGCRTGNGRSVLDSSIFNQKRDLTAYLVADMPVLLHMRYKDNTSPLAVALYLYRHCTKHQTENMTRIIHVLLRAGCNPVSELFDWNMMRHYMTRKPKGLELLKTLEDLASNPRPLFQLCAIRIRGMLLTNVIKKVNSLALPRELKDMLTLGHSTL